MYDAMVASFLLSLNTKFIIFKKTHNLLQFTKYLHAKNAAMFQALEHGISEKSRFGFGVR